MAKEIVRSLRAVDGKWEQYYFATVLSAVAVTDADDETRNAKEYIDSLITATADAMRFMGVIGADGVITSTIDATSGKVFADLTGYSVGWSFKVGAPGTYAGNTCEIGDTLVCVGTAGTNDDWYVMQANIDGAVTGPATSSDGHLAIFSGESGKIIKDSGIILSALQGAIAATHSHTNNGVLDATTAAFTTELKTMLESLDAAVSDSSHGHVNKEVLDTITQEMVNLWNGYDERITAVEDGILYTNDTPMVSAHGGIAVGETFDKVPITEMLNKILYPYIAPTIAASVVTPGNGGTYETGSTVTVTKIRATVTKKSSAITNVEVFDGSTSLGAKTDGVASGGAFDFTVSVGVTANKSFTAKATDATGKTVSANTGTFSFVYPMYYGVCTDGAEINEELVTGLTKKIEAKGNKTLTFNCNNQCMVFAYPASYGAIKKVIDPNNFDVTDTFTRHSVTITTLDGKKTAYYAYVNGASTVSSFNMIFQF